MNQLYSFLNNRRAKDGEPRNLLSMKPEHRGKYYVTRDDKSRFYNIYIIMRFAMENYFQS